MKKRVLGSVLAFAGLLALASCGGNSKPANWKVDNTGKVFNIYAWNEEFKGFFEKYASDEKVASTIVNDKGETVANPQAPAKYHVDGVEVNWVINPSDGGQYQDALDLALENQATASADKKVDMFLAEADYILKYAGEDVTQDIKPLGVTKFDNIYKYTEQAASDANGVVKGVSFQCCPSGLIYNRVIAKDLFGTDDPAVVGEKLSTWEKFDAVAAQAKAKGYLMTACDSETYRVFSNNASKPWVDSKGNLAIPDTVQQWMEQADKYVKEGYTVADDVWGAIKTENIAADANKALCCFGPAWYYNFCMGGSKAGDWGIVEGPMAHFWGGTWLLAAAGSDNTDLVAKVMNAFINDETVCTNLIKNEGQFTNNQKVNAAVANAADYAGNAFLGGQNDTKLFLELAKNIKFENITIYDQLCNEGFQSYYREYLTGQVTKEKAISNFYEYIKTKYPSLKTPA